MVYKNGGFPPIIYCEPDNKDLIKKYNGIAILTNLTLSTCDRIRNQALISLQSITTLY